MGSDKFEDLINILGKISRLQYEKKILEERIENIKKSKDDFANLFGKSIYADINPLKAPTDSALLNQIKILSFEHIDYLIKMAGKDLQDQIDIIDERIAGLDAQVKDICKAIAN